MTVAELSRQDRFNLNTTPIFNEDVGHRLMIARMKGKMTQDQLAHRLGISQQTLSCLERGLLRTADFNCTKLEIIFGGAGFSYIVIGANKDKYDERVIGQQFNEHQRAKYNKWKKFPGGKKPSNIPARKGLPGHGSET
jgi:DNA-binding XRE family transcriptional regulator